MWFDEVFSRHILFVLFQVVSVKHLHVLFLKSDFVFGPVGTSDKFFQWPYVLSIFKRRIVV
jgi:hypothetical protein